MIAALLFYNDEARFARMTTPERNALVERHIRFNTEVLQPRALLMVNRALQPTLTAQTVWPDEAGMRVVAGPFDRPGLCLSGFYLIDCTDLDEAVALAALYPMPVGLGCVEVRPALQDWDYAPSVDLDGTTTAAVWAVHADVARWPEWMPGVLATDWPEPAGRRAVGGVELAGAPVAELSLDASEPPNRLVFRLDFTGADAPLRLEYEMHGLPRHAVRVTHRATVPRALLDTVGSEFSGRLNASLRTGLQRLAAQLRRPVDAETPR